jgi:hypothetical protein
VDTANGGWNSERENKTCASKEKKQDYFENFPFQFKVVIDLKLL